MGAEPDSVESAGAGAAPVWTGDPLFALLDDLRGEGFHIGVGEYLEAQAAAAACHRDGIGHDPRRLRNYLAPVLCTTPEQQQLFYRRFDAWWIDCAGGRQEELPPPPLPPPPLHEGELGEVARRTRPWKWWAASALGVLAVLYLVGWPSPAGPKRSGPPRSAPPIKVPVEPSPAPTVQDGKDSQSGETLDGIMERLAKMEAGRTELPTARPAILNVKVVGPDGRPVPNTMLRVAYAGSELITTLKGHTDTVASASFSPDGRTIVTASRDYTARIWDSSTGKPLRELRQSERVQSASFSPDGLRLVTGDERGTVRVWAAAGEPRVFQGHEGAVNSVDFSPDGSRIVTASKDRTARVWPADGSRAPLIFRGHQDQVNSAAFSPDGLLVVTASNDKTAQVWAADGSGEPVIFTHESAVLNASFSPDGNHIVTVSGESSVRVWDARTGKRLVGLWSGDWLSSDDFTITFLSASFSPDGHHVITASQDDIRLWDASTGLLLNEPLSIGSRSINSASLDPSGTRLVTVPKSSNEPEVWNIANLFSNDLPAPLLTDPRGEIRLVLTSTTGPLALHLSQPDYQSPFPFILPARTTGGTIHAKLVPPTPWHRLFQHQRKIQAALALLPLVLAGPWLAWRVLRRRQLVLERRTTRGEQAVASPSLPEPRHDLYRGVGFARARVEAQRRQRVGAGDLDPDATVEATLRNLGFFTPVYRARLELPVYLVLIDRIGMRDQRALMVDELLDRLQAGGVALVRYDFDRDPRRTSLRFSGGAHRDLEELAGLHPGHRLAIFTEGAGFTDPATGRLAPWTRFFSAWTERVLLTPVPPGHWSRRELDLAAAGFAVLPAGEAGIERLADMFRRAEGAVPRPLEETWSPPYPELLASRPGRFLERYAPEEGEQSALCGELAFYLGPDGYRWLCSLAVYPELDWYFTLYLGLLLRRFDGRKVLDETTLLALTRLPWLRHGSMPDWLRLRLLRDLSENDEKEVRDWMRQFLEQREIPGSRFRLDVARPPEPEERGWRNRLRRWVESKDWRRLIKDWAHREPQEGALRDQIFVSFLLGTKPSRLQVIAPSAWRRLVWEQGMPVLGPRTNSVLLLTVLLAILGFAVGGPPLEWMARQTPAERSTIAAKLDSIRVTLSFSGDSWIAVATDGQPRIEELRVAGESMSFEAEREVCLTIGNPPATQVIVNGYPMKLDSPPGIPIKDLVINADIVKSLAASTAADSSQVGS